MLSYAQIIQRKVAVLLFIFAGVSFQAACPTGATTSDLHAYSYAIAETLGAGLLIRWLTKGPRQDLARYNESYDKTLPKTRSVYGDNLSIRKASNGWMLKTHLLCLLMALCSASLGRRINHEATANIFVLWCCATTIVSFVPISNGLSGTPDIDIGIAEEDNYSLITERCDGVIIDRYIARKNNVRNVYAATMHAAIGTVAAPLFFRHLLLGALSLWKAKKFDEAQSLLGVAGVFLGYAGHQYYNYQSGKKLFTQLLKKFKPTTSRFSWFWDGIGVGHATQ